MSGPSSPQPVLSESGMPRNSHPAQPAAKGAETELLFTAGVGEHLERDLRRNVRNSFPKGDIEQLLLCSDAVVPRLHFAPPGSCGSSKSVAPLSSRCASNRCCFTQQMLRHREDVAHSFGTLRLLILDLNSDYPRPEFRGHRKADKLIRVGFAVAKVRNSLR